MDEIMISVGFMKIGFAVIIILFALGVVAIVAKSKILELTLCALKALIYLGLIWYMWKYVSIKGLDEVGVITAFTFIVSCFECGSNVATSIEIMVDSAKA